MNSKEILENAIQNYTVTNDNLKSQLSNPDISPERKKDVERMIEDNQKQIDQLTEKLKKLGE